MQYVCWATYDCSLEVIQAKLNEMFVAGYTPLQMSPYGAQGVGMLVTFSKIATATNTSSGTSTGGTTVGVKL